MILQYLTQSLTKVRGTFVSLRVRAFRIFFLGQLTSFIGDWMQLTAANVLVLELRGGGIGLGIVNFAMLLPRVVLSPYAGILADRFPKRRILVLCNTLLLACSAVIGILLSSHSLTLTILYLLMLVSGILDAFNLTTRQAFIAEIVPRQQIINASALYATALTLSRVLGPIAAGLLVATSGVGTVFYANSLSYLVFLIALAGLRGLAPAGTRSAGSALSQLRRSFRMSWGVADYRTPLLLSGIIGGFGITSPVLLPIFVEQSLRSSAFGYAVLLGVVGAGTLAGSLLTAAQNAATDRLALLAALLLAFTQLVISISPTIGAAVVPLFASGVVAAVCLTMVFARLQILVEPQNRGMVLGMYTLISTGAGALVTPLMGFVAQIATARIGYAVCGAAVLLGSALLLLARPHRTPALPTTVPSSGSIPDS